MVIGIIPFFVLFLISNERYNNVKKSNELADIKKENFSEKKFFYVKENLKKGEKILEKDLVEVKLMADESVEEVIKENIIDRELKIDINKGTLINSDMVLNDEKVADDLRIHMFSGIDLHSHITVGSVIDIRISFPNGEDYILVSGKQVINRVEDKILIYVDEEEILKLSSAEVDKNMYSGTRIYAILYVKDYQKESIVNYPANLSVIELGNWDPNLLNKVFTEDVINKRVVLEEHLSQIKGEQIEK